MKPGLGLAQLLRVVLGAALLAAAGPFGPLPGASAAGSPGASRLPAASGVGWQTELVEQVGNIGHASSMALDASGYPHIAYYGFTSQRLKYAAWDGVAWSFDTVDDQMGDLDIFPHDQLLRTGIGIFSGTISIVYETLLDASGLRRVQFARGKPGDWHISLLDDSGNAFAPTLRLDKAGGAHGYRRHGLSD